MDLISVAASVFISLCISYLGKDDAHRKPKKALNSSDEQEWGTKSGEQANSELEKGAGRQQGGDKAHHEWEVRTTNHANMEPSYSSPQIICRKNGSNGVTDATYGGYHISYEVKKLMYEIPKSCSFV